MDINDDYAKAMRGIRNHHTRYESGQASNDAVPEPRPAIVPPVLYLPMREMPDDGYVAEVRTLPDGRRALIAYTALDRLAEHCGAAQTWALVQTDGLGVIKDQQPFDVVSFDPFFAEHLLRDGKLA